MLINLKLMGYEHEVALFALKSVLYQSDQRAIHFITDKDEGNGKYEHPFIGANK